MKIIDSYNLSAPSLALLKHDDYKKVGDYSASELPDSAQRRELERRHDHEIVIEAWKRFQLACGNWLHLGLEKTAVANSLQEERLSTKINGFEITGKSDSLDCLVVDEYDLIDFKFTSVYSYLLGTKADYEAQCNINDYLFHKNGFELNKLYLEFWFRDWIETKALHDPSYPQIPIMKVEVPKWSRAEQLMYIEARIKAHEEAKAGKLTPCTAEERWQSKDSWAVKKPDNKNAWRVKSTELEAEQERNKLKDPSKYIIEFRLGHDVRCERFCNAAKFCEQYLATQTEAAVAAV